MAAVNCVALLKVVVRALPFQFTVEAATKPPPLTVKVNAALPAGAALGEIELSVGTGLGIEMLNDTAPEVPPPGAGFTTVIEAVPVAAMSAALIAAPSCVALTKVVVRGLPFQSTREAATKPLPVTVRVNAAAPAVAELGASVLKAGTGLAAAIVNGTALEVPPPGAGLTTVTEAVPAAATSAPLMEAVSCEALTKAVLRALPFQLTADEETKLDPVSVKVNPAAPAVALAGDKEVRVGTGFGVTGTGGEA
jgi:hypothetical protein